MYILTRIKSAGDGIDQLKKKNTLPQLNLYINQLTKRIIKLVYVTLMFHFHLPQFLLAEKLSSYFSMLIIQHP